MAQAGGSWWDKPRLETFAASHVVIIGGGLTLVRMSGVAHGRLSCGLHRRWVWGAFDLTLLIPAARGDVTLTIQSLHGRFSRVLRLDPPFTITEPVAPAAIVPHARVDVRLRPRASLLQRVRTPHHRAQVVAPRVQAGLRVRLTMNPVNTSMLVPTPAAFQRGNP